MTKILIDENIPLLVDCLWNCGEIHTFQGRYLSLKNSSHQDTEYLFIRSTTKINIDFLENTHIKFIGSATSGIDHIDLDAIEKAMIYLGYAPGSNANSVAEYVVYSILKWANIKSIDLNHKIIGIIGYGNIGKIVANYSKLMGLQVIVNDPPLLSQGYEFPKCLKYSELDELFETCDIITNHVPLTTSGQYPTKSLINVNLLSLMKTESLFIHTSRGCVVEENELIQQIDEKNIYLAIDVWQNEPNINPHLAKRAILFTPHIAGYSWDGKIRGTYEMASHYKKFSGLEPNFDPLYIELNTYKHLPDEEFKNHKELFSKLENSRKLDEDSLDLLKTLEYDKNTQANMFDLLRKNYPKRRETL